MAILLVDFYREIDGNDLSLFIAVLPTKYTMERTDTFVTVAYRIVIIVIVVRDRERHGNRWLTLDASFSGFPTSPVGFLNSP